MPRTTPSPRHHEEEVSPFEQRLLAIAEVVRENPLMTIASAAIVLICLVVGIVYAMNAQAKTREQATTIAKALDADAPDVRASELERAVEGPGEFAAEAAFLMAESYFEAGQMQEAKTAFQRVVDDFGDSPFVPDALEGLGYVAENAGDYEKALEHYERIIEEYDLSFTARRQPSNMARCYEELGEYEEAMAAYEEQVRVFPDSGLAAMAEVEMDELRAEHPDLFEAPAREAEAPLETEVEPADAVAGADADAPETPAEPETTEPAAEEESAPAEAAETEPGKTTAGESSDGEPAATPAAGDGTDDAVKEPANGAENGTAE